MKVAIIVLVCFILGVAGVVAASITGLFNYQNTLSKIPYLNKLVAQSTTGKPLESYNALQQENDTLKKQVQALTLEDAVLSEGSQSSNNVSATGAGTALEGDGNTGGTPVFDPMQQQVYKNLANYYANMQPATAVAILGNQDQQTVSEILYEMDKDQASQILAAMDPAQAAKLLKIIASIDSEVKAQPSGAVTGE
jgi:flagellar motility protein MotE (MotC chaperone)